MSSKRSESKPASPDLIVIGASAGGIEALKIIVKDLPTDLPAALLVVIHVQPNAKSILPEILAHQGDLPVSHAVDGEEIRRGRIYLAPPDYHMVVNDGHLRLHRGPRENHSRPAINPLFRSAAEHYGRRVIGVILSGMLDDGTAGLIAVKMNGGITVVQDPRDALYTEMPSTAARYVDVDYRTPASKIAPLLIHLARAPIEEKEEKAPIEGKEEKTMHENSQESKRIQEDIVEHEKGRRLEGHTITVCPECSGPMWEFRNGEFMQFQCRVGHKYSAETMLASHAETLERALWVAARTLDERVSLLRETIQVTRGKGNEKEIARLRQEEQQAGRNAETVRRMISGPHPAEKRRTAKKRAAG